MTQTWDMDLHQRAAAFIQVITAVLDEQAPPTAPKPKTKPRWWTEELENMRKTLDRMARRKGRRPEQREERANLQRDYKLAIKSARKESFRKFCSSPRSVSELAGMVKALTNKPSYSALIVDSRGRVPETHACSHNNLLNHHFPSHQTQRSQSWGALRAATRDGLEDPIMELLTPQIVRNALHSFGPKKSPGPDGLRPKVLQNLGWVAICLLTDIYRESIASSTIPNSFLHMKVIFLPKDKPDKSSPKSYRPITLSSFFLKGLERIIQWHWQETILRDPLPNQHAYTRGRSCDTALSEVVDRLERGKQNKDHTLLVSLDCSGAFDN